MTPLGNVVPVAKTTLMRLLAAYDSPPVADAVKPIAYCVVADATGFADSDGYGADSVRGDHVDGAGVDGGGV